MDSTGTIMTARILDGNLMASTISQELRERIAKLRGQGIVPGLAVVLVGEDPASMQYVKMKGKNSQDLGMVARTLMMPESFSQAELIELIAELNADPRIHGILVQMPLPKHIDPQTVISKIDPKKDVDGLHPMNVGRMLSGEAGGFLPCTPHGVQVLLARNGIQTEGKHVVICGRSNIVGKPMAALMMQKQKDANATVTVCHSATKDLASYTRQADILIAAMGVAHFIKPDMVKEGAVVVDVGVSRIDDATAPRGYRLVGDVDFDKVKEKASAITPNPGGVGPMTRVILMSNTVLAAERSIAK
ncbi:MAG: Bifunctional protein FolD protein [Methanomassiliicoccales archaeon PtaU1.Bin124]|nr:MAG: Bifunctional protein FolD protein [Methanomassiliicoccales archaeon PtaU1.Bin124]